MTSVNLLGVHPLFYSPLCILRLNAHEEIKALLLEEIRDLRKHDLGIVRSNLSGWHSESDLFQLNTPGMVRVQKAIVEAVQGVTTQLAPGYDWASNQIQAEGWINVLGTSGLNTPHDHPAWVWSGCYYLNLPQTDSEISGNIEFMDVRTGIRTLTLNGASCFDGKFRVKPEEGMILIFPSYLRHWVYPNDSMDERVTIAFNIRYLSQ